MSDEAHEELEFTVGPKGAAMTLAAKAWGPKAGVPILMLHGWLDNAATFDLLAPRVAHGRRLVAVDFPGHGRSGHREPGGLYHFIDYIYDVIRAADGLGWTKFHLLGHSLGAAVGGIAAATYPDRIESFVGIEGLVPLTAEAVDTPRRLREHVAARRRVDLASAIGKQIPVYRDAAGALATRMIAGEFPVGDWIQGVVDRALQPARDGVSWRSDPRLKLPTAVRLTRGQTVAFLREVLCPVLLVRARGGIPILPEVLAEWVDSVKNLTLEELDGDHHVHLEHPDAVAAVVDGFWRRLGI